MPSIEASAKAEWARTPRLKQRFTCAEDYVRHVVNSQQILHRRQTFNALRQRSTTPSDQLPAPPRVQPTGYQTPVENVSADEFTMLQRAEELYASDRQLRTIHSTAEAFGRRCLTAYRQDRAASAPTAAHTLLARAEQTWNRSPGLQKTYPTVAAFKQHCLNTSRNSL